VLRLIPNVDDPEDGALEGINGVEINAWKKKDVLERKILLSTIDPNLQNTLLGWKTEKEVWVRLTSQHLKMLLKTNIGAFKYDVTVEGGEGVLLWRERKGKFELVCLTLTISRPILWSVYNQLPS
jgi:hypothetical protein